MERPLPLIPAARDALIASADGDGRFLLNQADTLYSVEIGTPLDPAGLSALVHRRGAVYDKDREGHYNIISALHKSLSGSRSEGRRGGKAGVSTCIHRGMPAHKK